MTPERRNQIREVLETKIEKAEEKERVLIGFSHANISVVRRIKTLTQLDELSKEVGISVEELAEYRKILEDSGKIGTPDNELAKYRKLAEQCFTRSVF